MLNKELPVKAILALIAIIGFFSIEALGLLVMSLEGQVTPSDVFALTNLALTPVSFAFGYFYAKREDKKEGE